jgi:hypothetical protein
VQVFLSKCQVTHLVTQVTLVHRGNDITTRPTRCYCCTMLHQHETKVLADNDNAKKYDRYSAVF